MLAVAFDAFDDLVCMLAFDDLPHSLAVFDPEGKMLDALRRCKPRTRL